MEDSSRRDLAVQLYRNLRILAGLTLVFLVVLALAPFKWHNSEWRRVQREYNRRATAAGQPTMAVALQQIWRPEIGLTDRCTSCHVGMGAAAPLAAGGTLFDRHPEVGHDVARMGCSICHLGQGRATTVAAAHGEVEHWEVPMLPGEHAQAACGGCHGAAVKVPPLSLAERGAYLFELHGCQSCHRVDGQGGTVGPDLSGVALKGFDREWHIRHLRAPTTVVQGSRMMSFGHLTDDEIDALLAYMDTFVGAPRLMRGKAVAVQLGCRGCHMIDGLGGDVSVDLNEALTKPPSDYDFAHVEGPHTLASWQREHLRDPQRVAPGSTMPPYDLPPEQEDALITYILSLREPGVRMEDLPEPAMLARLQERRDYAPGGRQVFGVFCAACHGPTGEGQVMPSLGTTVPGLKNPDVHAVLSRASLRFILENGRPGRFMPGWGSAGAGLRPQEIDALVDFLRADLPVPPSFEAVSTTPPDAALGRTVFANDCASCHGENGAGSVIGPAVITPEFQYVATDEFIYRTITGGRIGTAMPAHGGYDARTIASLIHVIRSRGHNATPAPDDDRRQMDTVIRESLGVSRLQDYRASGSPAYGKILFDSVCVSCHGPGGRGLIGPAIAGPSFLQNASDGFIAGTIVLGRSGRAMRSFGSHGLAPLERREIGDLIAYLRSAAANEPPEVPGYRTVQGAIPHGAELYGRYCTGCHGSDGEGVSAPALRNKGFLDAVSDGFLQATLVRGRPGTAMRAWARGRYGFGELEPEEINDIVAFIRTWQGDSEGG